ncbi:hypothetical protein BD408DRAFT_422326 [Parasitella parasitica]|nr:hypothetical protein BD408DRAFT_422326 [Parasitella parasitica]
MIFSVLKRRVKKSKWGILFLALAGFQVVVALGFLIPAFIHVREIHDGNGLNNDLADYSGKSFKVSGECLMFIIFELWRLWLAIDGVVRLNSRTIYASASFTILSFLFSIMLVAESVNWIKVINNSRSAIEHPEYNNLRLINQHLQIALSVSIFLLIFPTFWVANRITKDFGWDVYKKIGSSIKIQEMYIDLQWLSLMLKIDIFFEFLSYLLLFVYQKFNTPFEIASRLYMSPDDGLIVFIVLLLPSFILCRLSIARESHFLMSIFIFVQVAFLANTIVTAVVTFAVARAWYAYMMYIAGVLVAAIATMGLAIKCQLNFNKGLKDHVQWHPWKRNLSIKRKSVNYNTVHATEEYFGANGRRDSIPIDDDDSSMHIDMLPEPPRTKP